MNDINKKGIISLLNMSKQRLEFLMQELIEDVDKAEKGLIGVCEAFDNLQSIEQETDEVIDFGNILLNLMR